MDEVLTKTNNQYYEVYLFSNWVEKSKNLLDAEAKSLGFGTISMEKWKNMVGIYMMDITNFPDRAEKAYVSMVKFASNKMLLSTRKIHEKLVMADIQVRNSIKPTKTVTASVTNRGESIKINNLTFPLYKKISYLIDDPNDIDEDIIRLYLRYFMINPTLGVFWSIPPELYRFLSRSNPIECFASPFNYNAAEFCSLFKEDKDIEYRDAKCIGNFYDVIPKLNKKRLLVFNPPYTNRILKSSIRILIDYMERVPGCKFVALLPDWTVEVDEVNEIINYGNTKSVLMESQTFNVFDFSISKNIHPKDVSLYLLANDSNDEDKSEELLESCKKYILYDY